MSRISARRARWLDALAIALLVAAAAHLRWRPLAPPSLWLDDAWVALVSRVHAPADVLRVGSTSPGFGVLLKTWLVAAGGSPLAAQALPFLAGVAAPPLAYLVARRLALSRPVALLVGSVLVAAPVHVIYASRVKQYTVEAVLALLLIWLTVRVLEHPAVGSRWLWLTIGCIGATAVSGLLGVITGAALVAGAVAAAPDWSRTGRHVISAVAAFTGFASAWWWLVLRPASNESLRRFWAGAYIETDEGISGTLRDTGERLTDLAGSISPLSSVIVLGLLAASALVVVVRRPSLAIVLAGPTVVALGLALARQAPIGTRTDAYLLPGLALLVGAGLHEATQLSGAPRERFASVVAVGASLLIVVTAAPARSYPAEDVRHAVQALEQQRLPGDGVLVYPLASFAYALYTPVMVRIRSTEEYATRFAPVVRDDAVVILDNHRDEPDAYYPALSRVAEAHRRIWFLEAHASDDVPAIEEMLRDLGLSPVVQHRFEGAKLTLWAVGGN